MLVANMNAAEPPPPVEIIAHRGYSAKAPENTVAAFRAAWEAGADACELDLYLSRDGEVVVIHDTTTKRTTGVDLPVAETASAELLKLDAGAWKDAAYAGERIPLLQEALDTLPAGKQRFFLEIKCGPEVVPALKAILEPMRDRSAQLVAISFNRESAAETKKALPWLPVYLLASGKTRDKKPNELRKFIDAARESGLDGLNLGRDWPWSETLVKEVREAGLGLYVWTVNDPGEARRLAALGLDGITTDDPVVIREALAAGK